MMLAILAQSLRTERIEERLELARWSSGNALLAGGLLTVVVLYVIYWLYRREARGQVSAGLRWTLITSRALVLLCLGLIGLEPILVNYVHRRLEGCTLVLADASASMSLADPYRTPADAQRIAKFLGSSPENLTNTAEGGRAPSSADRPTRANLADRLLQQDQGKLLRALAERNPVKLFTFSDAPTLQAQIADSEATTGETPVPHVEINPAGPATNMALAVRAAVDAVAGSPIAGLVLLSDGGFNQGESAEVIAAMLKQKGVPAFTVGIGDPTEPVNATVVEISAPRAAFKNDPFNVTVRLAAHGVGDQPIKVELLEKLPVQQGTTSKSRNVETSKPESGTHVPRVVDSMSAKINPDGNVEPVVFRRKVATPGAVGYVARIPVLDFESITGDNQRETLPPVQVLDDKMRLLLVAGAPSYDYRYLARMLERDKSVDVSCWLQSADVKAVRDGTTVIKELPATPEELFKYDAIILLDPDPTLLDPAWAGIVATFVTDHGGGLLYEAGNKYAGKFLRAPAAASIVELLPVAPDPDAEIIVNELGYSQRRSWPLAIPDAALGDPLLRLADSAAENRAIWASLDGPFWHYPVRREKPVAQVLMRHSDPRMSGSFGSHVLFATQFVGAGRSAYLGLNSTWRWRKGDDKLFNRFWTQVIRFLVEGKLLGGKSRCQIQTAKDQFEVGESVVITVRALDEKFAPLAAPQLDLVVADPAKETEGGLITHPTEGTTGETPVPQVGTTSETVVPQARTVALAPMPGREGYYQGRFTADRAGMLRLSLKLPGAPADQTTRRDLSIVQPDLEMQNTAMNRPLLQQFAAATNGKYLDIDDAAKLPDLVPDRSRTYVVRERPRPLWDNKYTLIALMTLLMAEWILRKKAKLL